MRLTEQPGGAGSHHAVLGGVEDGFRQWDGVSHHGTVQAVLCHDAAAAPTLLTLSPLGPPVLEPHLENTRDILNSDLENSHGLNPRPGSPD